ncbi:MAG: class I SAM-dependent methyltransferase [Acidimicrobiales bacterium]|jgi:SAM-dependent methyltransferase
MPRARSGDFDYERDGGSYDAVRRADPSIAARIASALGPARTVLNVGAGAGSYEPEARRVVAVEPSAAMRARRPPGVGPVVDAVAERLPFAPASFDAALAVLTVHHWRDRSAGLQEMRRIARGPVVVLTFDPEALERYWLAHYAPELMEVERRRYPPLDAIDAALGGGAAVWEVPIPRTCTDGFTEAFFGRPEAFLDPRIRRAQSAWGFLEAGVEERCVARLRHDLESGTWDERYGSCRRQDDFAGAVRLVVHQPPRTSGAVVTVQQ